MVDVDEPDVHLCLLLRLNVHSLFHSIRWDLVVGGLSLLLLILAASVAKLMTLICDILVVFCHISSKSLSKVVSKTSWLVLATSWTFNRLAERFSNSLVNSKPFNKIFDLWLVAVAIRSVEFGVGCLWPSQLLELSPWLCTCNPIISTLFKPFAQATQCKHLNHEKHENLHHEKIHKEQNCTRNSM